MRRLILTLALLAAASPLAAQGNAHNHAHGGGALPDGWHARLDRPGAGMENVRFTAMDGGYHATLGPAAIFWNPEHAATGEYRVQAAFTQTRAPAHPEAYGLFLGGKDLESAPDYFYFLVRGDGKYTVKHRAPNGDVHTLTDWTEHAAVVKQDAAGKATNTLAAEAGAFGLRFLVNGTKVAELPGVAAAGMVGLRINHNLDVHVDGFTVEKR
jgi:hypothetical protein